MNNSSFQQNVTISRIQINFGVWHHGKYLQHSAKKKVCKIIRENKFLETLLLTRLSPHFLRGRELTYPLLNTCGNSEFLCISHLQTKPSGFIVHRRQSRLLSPLGAFTCHGERWSFLFQFCFRFMFQFVLSFSVCSLPLATRHSYQNLFEPRSKTIIFWQGNE